ncbi:MAG: hypothetical protein KGJ13_07595 [Patescibacteria group bacterium]|nr:hypothetical protein [Patescibacteria group bacterium]
MLKDSKLWTGVVVIIALLVLGWYFFSISKRPNAPAAPVPPAAATGSAIQAASTSVSVSTSASVATSPAANPIGGANPFKNLYKNPF